MSMIALTLRIGIGLLFAVAGFVKLGDPTAFAIEITNYRFLPQMAPVLAVMLPFVELGLGVAIIVAPRTWRNGAALALAGLSAVFTVAVAQAVGRGINVDCGCFGAQSGPVTMWTVARDVTLIAVAVAILFLDRPSSTRVRG
jgi:hypothetical protein